MTEIDEIRRDIQPLDTRGVLRYAMERFGDKIALSSSMQAEDQVLTDMLCDLTDQPRIFTLDTGRLPQETYDTIAETNRRYGIRIKLLFPDREQVEQMVNEHGPNLMYDSVEKRKRCCYVRKVVPLQRELATCTAWITGMRREQSVTREDLQRVEWDELNGLIKFNPLADWTCDDIWEYIRSRNVPYNPLHDQGYASIGCAPCTRPIGPGEDIRAGRWWWEQPEHKECGLHWADEDASAPASSESGPE
ncbi:MAG: phosphoadenylyl-sulfate reductase [Planctomycetota bacterium]